MVSAKMSINECGSGMVVSILIVCFASVIQARGIDSKNLIDLSAGNKAGDFEHVGDSRGHPLKRADDCPPWKPFQCPEGICIPLKYLCDYNVDCPQSHYDENKKMCTAAVRPTVESTEEFLSHQLRIHGKNYFVKLFGPNAADNLAGMGGVASVSVALSENPRLNDFASSVGLKAPEAEHLRQVLKKVADGDKSGLQGLGFSEAEVESLQPVVEQLVDTGFLKTE